jgi:hypothetical protein
MKNSIYTIGDRTRDLPACSTVTKPTAPSRAPISHEDKFYFLIPFVGCVSFVTVLLVRSSPSFVILLFLYFYHLFLTYVRPLNFIYLLLILS